MKIMHPHCPKFEWKPCLSREDWDFNSQGQHLADIISDYTRLDQATTGSAGGYKQLQRSMFDLLGHIEGSSNI